MVLFEKNLAETSKGLFASDSGSITGKGSGVMSTCSPGHTVCMIWQHPRPNNFGLDNGGSTFLRNICIQPTRLHDATIQMTAFELKLLMYTRPNNKVITVLN
jgi:hypothetical protein